MLITSEAAQHKKKKKVSHTVKRTKSVHYQQSLITGELGLQKIMALMTHRANAGVAIQSLQTGQLLYQQSADQLFMPASNMKVITAFAALKFLGPEFVYYTRLMTDQAATIQDGVLNGNLYLQYPRCGNRVYI